MRRFTTPGWIGGHLLVLAASLVCLRLAWWQLIRSEEADGTLQNTGYALLWPAFAVAFVVMWIRFLKLEASRLDEEEEQHRESLERVLAEAESLTAEAAPVRDAATGADGTMDTPAPVAGGDTGGVGRVEPEDREGQDNGQNIGRDIYDHDQQDDPELAAYNRALAALAEKDRRAR